MIKKQSSTKLASAVRATSPGTSVADGAVKRSIGFGGNQPLKKGQMDDKTYPVTMPDKVDRLQHLCTMIVRREEEDQEEQMSSKGTKGGEKIDSKVEC